MLRGDIDNLRLRQPTSEQSYEEEIAEHRTKRSNNSFELLNIPVGEVLRFLYHDTVCVSVLDNKNQVEYNGEGCSVTAAAKRILIEKYGWSENLHVNGWRYFTKDGVTLNDLRYSLEQLEEE